MGNTAQDELGREGTWRTYSIADGLAAREIEHIAEDREGYIWFATWDSGASRFDGHDFRTFTRDDGLCGNQVSVILNDSQGRLWFGTRDGGACYFDGRDFHCFAGDDALARSVVQYLCEDRQGRVWVGGPGVLGYVDGEGYQDLVPQYRRQFGRAPSAEWPLQCFGIAQDEGGDLWLGYDDLVRYDGETFTLYGVADGLPDNDVAYALGVCQGVVWVGGEDGVVAYDGRSFAPAPFAWKGYVRKIQIDRDGSLWVCGGEGALRHTGANSSLVTPRHGLPNQIVNHVYQDREGNFWFATWGGGAACYDPGSIHAFGPQDGLPQHENLALAEGVDGRIWMGWGERISHFTATIFGVYDGRDFILYSGQDGIELGAFLSLCPAGDDLWLGGSEGVLCYDGQ